MKFHTSKFAIQFLAKSMKSEAQIAALNKIIEDLNYQEREKQYDNIAFAKLFLYLYEGNLLRYKDTTATYKHIRNILKQPLQIFYDNILIAYNELNTLSIFKSKEIETDWIKIVQREENDESDEVSQFMSLSEDDKKRISKDSIPISNLITRLDDMITTQINNTRR